MNSKKINELILTVANEISNLIPDCCGVTLGGSRMNNLEDRSSDVEMYFYTHEGPPSIASITECLTRLNATHKRTNSFLWENKMPWGPHSFFVLDNLYFEIGYRNIDDIKKRILFYEKGNVEPIQDCHDLGLGYMPSGLAASVATEKLLIKETEELLELKKIANNFPLSLVENLKNEYFETAKSLIKGKLLSAVEREDIFLYESISGRIVRCLMVMAFALGKNHFPGDKWNEKLLLKTNWTYKEKFIQLLKKHFSNSATSKKELKYKRNILLRAYEIIEKEVVERL